MKKEFTITIEEVVSQNFLVEAISEEEALEQAVRQYNEGKLVVDQGNLMSAKAIGCTTGKETIIK